MKNLIINKDILSVDTGFILHQVNCRGVMGAGLAKAIATKWPIVKQDYIEKCQVSLLGDYILTNVQNNLFVCSIFGQNNYGTLERHTDYAAFGSAIGKFQLNRNKNLPVWIPYKIGCGLGGGDWDVISKLIEILLPDATICKN